MRILVLANNDTGLFRFRSELLERLVLDNELFVSVPFGNDVEKVIGIGCKCIDTKIDRRGINPINDFRLLLCYVKIIKEIRPDIVLTYTIKPNVYGGIACQIRHIPYIVNITGLGSAIENGGVLQLFTLLLYRIGLKKAENIFFQNRSNYDFFIKKKIVKGKTTLIPGSGVNLEVNRYEEYLSTEKENRFLFVGRIMRDKGIFELIDAFLKLQMYDSNIALDIVGPHEEDIINLQKSEKIHFWGLQTDVHLFMKNAHCVILPSYHEGMANVLLEAAATGRPVIASRIPGCQETFEEGITGIGCEPRNYESLFEAMKHFLELTNDQKKQMGLLGRLKMEKEFNREIVINSYLEAINSVKNGTMPYIE